MLNMDVNLEAFESLPMEVRRNCLLIRDLDLRIKTIQRKIEITKRKCRKERHMLTPDENRNIYREFKNRLLEMECYTEDKIMIAEQNIGLVKKLIRKADFECTKFTSQLERLAKLPPPRNPDEPCTSKTAMMESIGTGTKTLSDSSSDEGPSTSASAQQRQLFGALGIENKHSEKSTETRRVTNKDIMPNWMGSSIKKELVSSSEDDNDEPAPFVQNTMRGGRGRTPIINKEKEDTTVRGRGRPPIIKKEKEDSPVRGRGRPPGSGRGRPPGSGRGRPPGSCRGRPAGSGRGRPPGSIRGRPPGSGRGRNPDPGIVIKQEVSSDSSDEDDKSSIPLILPHPEIDTPDSKKEDTPVRGRGRTSIIKKEKEDTPVRGRGRPPGSYRGRSPSSGRGTSPSTVRGRPSGSGRGRPSASERGKPSGSVRGRPPGSGRGRNPDPGIVIKTEVSSDSSDEDDKSSIPLILPHPEIDTPVAKRVVFKEEPIILNEDEDSSDSSATTDDGLIKWNKNIPPASPNGLRAVVANDDMPSTSTGIVHSSRPGNMPVYLKEPTYCFCNRVSFGKMIGCDNSRCPREWFHFGCVNLTVKPKGNWYCPQCRTFQVKIKQE